MTITSFTEPNERKGVVIERFCNKDLRNVVTPVNVDKFEQLLWESQYPREEVLFLTNGFRYGFDIGYKGPQYRKDFSRNLPLRVGSKIELWNKVMKEVKLKRYVGPFESPPSEYFIQSPLGLSAKGGGSDQTHFSSIL